MKKNLLIFLLILISKNIEAQQNNGIFGDKNWTDIWTNFKPKLTDYNETNEILSGEITANKTLTKSKTYLLTGIVYVKNNAVLTIEPGTTIRGDFETNGTLVVTKGSKIIANGSETDPIVFTSNKHASERNAGDWGGVIIFGEAPINKFGGMASLDFNLNQKDSSYGGANDDSNSGVFRYVRIEFAGHRISATKELNGLSLAGVGSKTKLEFIQISYSNDDSFECYGGNLMLNNLVSYRATDDDFDFSQGVQCAISNSIALRNPYSSDSSKSRCFEVESYDKVEDTDFSRKLTSVFAENITLLNTEDNNEGLVKEAIFVKENSFFKLSNSVVSGFEPGIILDNKIANAPEGLEMIILDKVLFNNCKKIIKYESSNNTDLLDQKYAINSSGIAVSNLNQLDLFTEPNLKKNIDFRIKTNKNFSSR